MHHATPLLSLIAAGLGLAFLFGLLAHRLRVPLIAGYLAAGIVIGPFTPGFVADQELAYELAELGVILLMFGVGLHFSLRDLLAVRAVALPGALAQIAVATLAGMALAWAMDWSLGAGLLFGLSLSVASTVVMLRALQERGLIATEQGRIAVGWLIVEDLAMVVALVVLPPLAGLLGGEALEAPGGGSIVLTLLWTVLYVAVFLVVMLVIGARAIPWILHRTAGTRSRELFRLAVLAIALGVAYGSAQLFGVSFALGAFFAGLVMATSTLSQQAARETLPLRDAFAVLFFVSVGMLLDPMVIWERPLAVLATLAVIMLVKSAAAYGIVRLAGHGQATAMTISASLAQIGEFSFILVTLGLSLDLLPAVARDLVVAGAIGSIVLNPLVFAWLDRRFPPPEAAPAPDPALP